MTFYTDEETPYSWVNVLQHLCGWGNVIHTGIQAVLLDEVMGMGAFYLSKRIPLTTSITLSLQKPVFWDRGEVLAQTSIMEYSGQREVIMQGKILQGNSEPRVIAQGTFRLFTLEAVRPLNIMNQAAIDTFEGFVRHF
jgi:acyl-coenzyme A thioesterase PaaI-like protein